jgi:hypothetical protein
MFEDTVPLSELTIDLGQYQQLPFAVRWPLVARRRQLRHDVGSWAR